MSEEQTNNQNTPETPQTPVTPQGAEQPTTSQQPPMGAPVPPQQPPMGQMPPQQQTQPMYAVPQPQPQPLYPPAPLMQLTGGMKFGWLVVGALLGIPGIVIAWLVNVDKFPQVKSEAIKFSIIGLVIWIVLGFLISLAVGGMIAAAAASIGSYGSYGYHGSF